jgi:hypothetical protein
MDALLVLTFGMIFGGYFAGCNKALFEELFKIWLGVGCIWLTVWSVQRYLEMRHNATLPDRSRTRGN